MDSAPVLFPVDSELGQAYVSAMQLAGEYAKAAQVTGDRLYTEAMEQILPRIKKMIVDKNGNLDLTIIRKGDPPPPAPKK